MVHAFICPDGELHVGHPGELNGEVPEPENDRRLAAKHNFVMIQQLTSWRAKVLWCPGSVTAEAFAQLMYWLADHEPIDLSLVSIERDGRVTTVHVTRSNTLSSIAAIYRRSRLNAPEEPSYCSCGNG